MRKRAPKEARTTLFVVDTKVWEKAKELAAREKVASVSEVVFDALKDKVETSQHVALLRALEKRFELGHYTIGAVAQACGLTRGEVLEQMEKLGFSLDEGDQDRARARVHDLLREAGVAPREERLFLRLSKPDVPVDLEVLPHIFEPDRSDLRNELQLLLDETWGLASRDRRIRASIESTLGRSGTPTTNSVLTSLRVPPGELEIPGPEDWTSLLLFLAGASVVSGQLQLLLGHFGLDEGSRVTVLSWLTRFQEHATESWLRDADPRATAAFKELWQTVTGERTIAPLPLATSPAPVTVEPEQLPHSGRKTTEAFLVEKPDLAFPVEAELAVEGLRALRSILGALDRAPLRSPILPPPGAKGFTLHRSFDERLVQDMDPHDPGVITTSYNRNIAIEVKTRG
ncbi:MAG: hypothetical protein KGJ23_09915 [Euryarchaeota archaeon]|nr:hypothetical protein [Euryarchaeota archaeon]MDE1836919.1 hypothetical protein [Euryarchaeota archaeon]MDE1882250.1 hypothetical protein [Euryarchaeota archaeon]MDE2045096.1 hypothetical protein [Thermoplasmata archaeon]